MAAVAASLALAMCLAPPANAQPLWRCVDFDDLPTGTSYPCCGTVFTSRGVDITTNQFQWSGGTWTGGGQAFVDGAGPIPGGSPPNQLMTNNVNVDFDMADYFAGAPVTLFRIKYAELGGNVNLRVNGVFVNMADWYAMPNGTLIGGVRYYRSVNGPPTNYYGMIRLIAPPGAEVWQVELGGQENWLDDACASSTITLGDLNCDGHVDGFDIDAFVLALTDSASYHATYPDCERMLADIDGDGDVTGFDIDPFVKLLTGS